MVYAGALLFAQASLSFSSPAAPASRVIPEIGKAAGVTLTVAPSLAREVLLIRARSTTFRELTLRVAQATGGEWSAVEGGGYRLELSRMADVAQRRAESKAAADGILANFRASLKGGGTGPTDPRATQPIAAILANLPPETVGEMGFKDRVVLSTSPTETQRRLPPSALDGIDLRGPAVTMPGVGPAPTAPIEVVQIVLRNALAGESLAASMIASDGQGRTVATRDEWLYRGSATPTPPGGWPKLPHGEALVRLSKPERELGAAFERAGGMVGRNYGMEDESQDSTLNAMYSDADLTTPAVGRALPDLLQPEAREPLALLAGPLLAGLAEAQGQNLVADIPDVAFLHAAHVAAREAVPASEVVREAWNGMGMDVREEGAWIVARPRTPSAARDLRLDRPALGTAIRALARDRALDLDAQAAYAMAQPLLDSQRTFEAAYFAALDPSFGKRISASCVSGERQTLRLYRALGGGRLKLSLPFSSLPPGAQNALTDIVFNSNANPQIVRSVSAPNSRGVVTYANGSYGAPRSIAEERTVYWGKGIPRSAVLTVAETTEPSIFGAAPNGVHPRMSRGGESYGIQTDGKGVVSTSTSLPYLARYQAGTVRRIVFDLRGADGVQVTRRLEEDSIPKDAPVIEFDSLPEELRTRIANNQEAIRRMISDYQQQRQRQNQSP